MVGPCSLVVALLEMTASRPQVSFDFCVGDEGLEPLDTFTVLIFLQVSQARLEPGLTSHVRLYHVYKSQFQLKVQICKQNGKYHSGIG
jgi:hypothetical protein